MPMVQAFALSSEPPQAARLPLGRAVALGPGLPSAPSGWNVLGPVDSVGPPRPPWTGLMTGEGPGATGTVVPSLCLGFCSLEPFHPHKVRPPTKAGFCHPHSYE